MQRLDGTQGVKKMMVATCNKKKSVPKKRSVLVCAWKDIIESLPFVNTPCGHLCAYIHKVVGRFHLSSNFGYYYIGWLLPNIQKILQEHFCNLFRKQTLHMQSHRQYRRYITEYKVMYTGFHRLNSLLIRLSDRLAQINRIPSLDELLVLCRILSPIQCNSNLYIYMSDNFIGGLVLYFWLFIEGETWIKTIIKKSLKVLLSYVKESRI